MSSKGLKVATPPPRPASAPKEAPKKRKRVPTKLVNVAESDMVQFNRRVTRATAKGYEMMAIQLNRKVPDLLDEALELLEEKYGKI